MHWCDLLNSLEHFSLQEVRSVKAVVVLLVDLLDASGTLMSKVGCNSERAAY